MAQVYPAGFIRAVLQSIKLQKMCDARGLFLLGAVSKDESHRPTVVPEQEETAHRYVACWDDLTGENLPADNVRAARREDIEYYRSMSAFKVVPVEEAWRVSGRAPIGVRWIDTNTGDVTRPNIRCRLVAQDFNTGPDHEMHAGTLLWRVCVWFCLEQ